ncbi:MAG: protein phosphatase 2C family protein [Chlamydiia bacterium]|nr:protein phosphatase 2C family protein [Chlamydiia bacterium]
MTFSSYLDIKKTRLFLRLVQYEQAAQRLQPHASPTVSKVAATAISLQHLQGHDRLHYHPRDLKLTLSKPVEKKLQNEIALAEAHCKNQKNDTKAFLQQARKASLPEFPIHAEAHALSPHIQVGVAHAQGMRPTMEDAHIAAVCTSLVQGKQLTYELFSVIDGHGGDETAYFVAAHLQKEIEDAITKHGTSDEGMFKALKEAFVRLDARAKLEVPGHSGAVVVATLKIGNALWTANLGDARALLASERKGIQQLSVDAKPGTERFKKSIEKRGGRVVAPIWDEDVDRVNGCLAIPRAIKDDGHKLLGIPIQGRQRYAISPRPKITKVSLDASSKTHLLIQGCDGIWDVASSHDVAAVAKDSSITPTQLAQQVVNGALRRGSTDNCSVLVAKFSQV